jgi:hypothetical protein
MEERRGDLRVIVENVSVAAGDGNAFFHGIIVNISRRGLCMGGLSRLFNTGAGRLSAIITVGNGCYFRMCVMPKWSIRGPLQTIGAELVAVPVGWEEMVMVFERGI